MFLEFAMSYFQKYPVGWAPPTCNAVDLAIMVGGAHPTLGVFATLGSTIRCSCQHHSAAEMIHIAIPQAKQILRDIKRHGVLKANH
jgi:hypothetical protein